MANESEPIKYSNLVQDDGAIDEAISMLILLRDTFVEVSNSIKSQATQVKASIQTVSGATEDGRKVTRKAVDDAARLAQAQKDLAFATSDVGVRIAELKAITDSKNKQTKQEADYVNATSESYNAFKAELTLLIGEYRSLTKEQALNSAEGSALINKIISLKNNIKTLDEALKIQRASTQAGNQANAQSKVVLTEVEKATKRLSQAQSAENATLLSLMIQTKEANAVARLNAILANEQAGSYNALSAQYALNKIQLNHMTQAERETTDSGKAFVAQTNEIYQNMIRLQEVTGTHTLSVGNYRKVWDGLGHSVGQVVREMPAMAINMNTLFLALSNNIPILVDEINMLKARNAEAAASGEATVSVYKKIASAMFSWNTVIVLVLTVLSMYGNEIVSFIGNLFRTEKAILRLAEAAEVYHKASVKGREDAQAELVRLRLLYNATQDHTKSIKYRTAAVEHLRKLYPEWLKNISDEQVLAGAAANSYGLLAANILKAAKARAAEDQIVENNKEILKLKDLVLGYKALAAVERKNTKTIKANLPKDDFDETGKMSAAYSAERAAALKAGESVEEYGIKAQEAAFKIGMLEAANIRLASSIDITDLKYTKDTKDPKTPKPQKDRTEEILAANLAIEKMYAEAVTSLNEDELVKRGEAARDEYASDSAALMNKYHNDADLTEKSRDLILAIIIAKGEKLKMVSEEIQDEINLRALKKQADALQLALEATEEHSYEEAEVRLKILENNRQQELIQNKQLIASQRQSEVAINKKWDTIIANERAKSQYTLGMRLFDLQQDFNKSEFDLLRTTEAAKTKFKLQQEKERWQKVLEYAKRGALKLSDIEIKTIENTIKKLDLDINDAGKKQVGLYELFGLNLKDSEKAALNEAIDTTVGYLKEALDAEIALADIAIDRANKRIDIKQKALDAEIEARNNGYAFNVSQAQRELDLEKAQLDKATKQKERAVEAQQRLDTVAQASSLVTASANIWASLSAIPVVGYVLAIAAIAAMWGSFAMAKIKANSVTNAKTYGDGGFEILKGGSHQSGNDIQIGNMPDGRERRAEGGEGLAIFSKSKTRKYAGILPGIIDSINKGIFEKKYARAFKVNNTNEITVNNNFGTLESDVQAIRQQGETRRMLTVNGQEVIYYKNLKTTVRHD